MTFSLAELDDLEVVSGPSGLQDGVPLLGVLRNEMCFRPPFLARYRRHGRDGFARAVREWSQEYASGITRDQISLPYLLWRNDVSVHRMTCSYADSAGPFIARRHKQGRWLSDLNQRRKIWASSRQRGS